MPDRVRPIKTPLITIRLQATGGRTCQSSPGPHGVLHWRYVLDGDRRAGLWLQAEYVEPLRLLGDLEHLGIEVVIEYESRVLGAWATSDIMRS